MRPKRQKVALAFAGSILLHGIALLLFAGIVALRPPAAPEAPPPDEPLKLEMEQEEQPATPPPILEAEATPTPTPKPKIVVDATGEDSTATPAPMPSSLTGRRELLPPKPATAAVPARPRRAARWRASNSIRVHRLQGL